MVRISNDIIADFRKLYAELNKPGTRRVSGQNDTTIRRNTSGLKVNGLGFLAPTTVNSGAASFDLSAPGGFNIRADRASSGAFRLSGAGAFGQIVGSKEGENTFLLTNATGRKRSNGTVDALNIFGGNKDDKAVIYAPGKFNNTTKKWEGGNTDLTTVMGAGNDRVDDFGHASVNTRHFLGDGDDTVNLGAWGTTNTRLFGNKGNDQYNVTGKQNTNLQILEGATDDGNDSVVFDGDQNTKTKIALGLGNDKVDVTGGSNQFDWIDTGDGADKVTLDGTKNTGSIYLNGRGSDGKASASDGDVDQVFIDNEDNAGGNKYTVHTAKEDKVTLYGSSNDWTESEADGRRRYSHSNGDTADIFGDGTVNFADDTPATDGGSTDIAPDPTDDSAGASASTGETTGS